MSAPWRAKYLLLVFSLIAMFSAELLAGWKDKRERLSSRYVSDPYQLYLSAEEHSWFGKTQGSHPSNQALASHLFRQVKQADVLYQKLFSLQHPLGMPRYKNAKLIYIHVLDLGDRKGSAYDEVSFFEYQKFTERRPGLVISISDQWLPPNRTPQHEIFHLYQYAYTYFKNPWFLEGLASSVGNHFNFGRWEDKPLPADETELEQLLNRSYSAKYFWNRLAKLCSVDCSDRGSEGNSAGSATCGANIVKPLLSIYDRLDDVAAIERGIENNDWPESDQRSVKNNRYLLIGLKMAIHDSCPVNTSKELTRFSQLVDTFTRSNQ